MADNSPNINKVNEVGRINDTVDISSEDLKMMRELAEMNAIQNFVSLTPTVNVQTGDIRNGYDVDTIIRVSNSRSPSRSRLRHRGCMALVDRCGIWLSWNNQEDGFELPVLPAELARASAATARGMKLPASAKSA